jgi:hypothetical protein
MEASAGSVASSPREASGAGEPEEMVLREPHAGSWATKTTPRTVERSRQSDVVEFIGQDDAMDGGPTSPDPAVEVTATRRHP